MLKNSSFDLILKNAGDGVLLLTRQGNIAYLNPAGERVLGIGKEALGVSYLLAMKSSMQNDENDAFHQYLLNAVTEKEVSHRGEVTFVNGSGERYRLHLTSSFYEEEEGGVIIQFTDITEIEKVRKRKQDAAILFVTTTIIAALWNFVYALWHFRGEPVPPAMLTPLMYLMGMVLFLVLWKKTDFSVADMGLSFRNVKKNILTNLVVTVIGFAMLVGLRMLLGVVIPEHFTGKSFFNFAAQKPWQYIYYIPSVFMQQFISQGVLHTNLQRMLDGPHKNALALGLSVLLFSSMHMYYGLIYMIGAIVLLLGIGMLYARQRSIWAICIPHYVLGTMLVVMGFI